MVSLYGNTLSGAHQELASFPGPSCRSAMYIRVKVGFPGFLLCICILETGGNKSLHEKKAIKILFPYKSLQGTRLYKFCSVYMGYF